MSRYLSNELSLQETEELLEWLDEDPVRTDLLRELQDTWDKTKDYPVNFKVDTRAAWQNLRSNLKTEEREKKISFLTPLRLSGIVASALIILFSGISAYLYYRKTGIKFLTVETLPGERRQIVLPDGTKVWLNSGSSISYAESFSDEGLRKVILKGEGFFEVSPNVEGPLLVHTGKIVTRVSEASFNLRQDQAGSVKVSVLAGKVSILSEGRPDHELILQAGEEGLVSKEGRAGKVRFENQNFLFRKPGRLSFNHASFNQVIRTIEESYSVRYKIRDTQLLRRQITIPFNQAPLRQVIDTLEKLLDLRIEKPDSVYIISTK